jgi:hypothetical protein
MILDTNIVIAALNGEQKVTHTVSEWKRSRRALFISSISFAETLALPNISKREEKNIVAFLDSLIEIPFDNQVAKLATFFKRYYKLRLPDAAIAASAFINELPLVTRDRQFYKIKGITVVEI